ncbi:lymphocyte antigen 86 isoform X2 [Hemicordylus capensis]|uniref:lymphocyte antigen 86 isoform X2 n=1 Tax=Hemicordylus capensis TaxID=884348 RepID=UPI002304B09E|nr:lymphocyte antigen 86 isoform X2 [Hemicordylus capensis]
MKTFKGASLIILLIYTSTSIRWPLHTVCKNDHLELYYRSCDPLQDFAFSLDRCPAAVIHRINIRLATILRRSIIELFVDVSLNVNGKHVTVYSKQLCERNNPQYTFCGMKKGEYFYYEGPVSLGDHDIPQVAGLPYGYLHTMET